MKSSSDNQGKSQIRVYKRSESVVFLKTTEAFGGLSNMAGGFPLRVSGIYVRTSEALYQACRFPNLPRVQRLILDEASPMTAKMKSKPFRDQSRHDWDRVRVAIMRWCLRVKLALNWRQFGELLLATGDRPIVEESRRDPFWGAKSIDDGTLVGMNVLGRLLMELREELRDDRSETLKRVEPLQITHFLILERPIGIVGLTTVEDRKHATMDTLQGPPVIQSSPQGQTSFFDNSPGTFSSSLGDTNNRYLMRGLNPYPQYKESGLPWLGHVPIDWEIKRAKSVLHTVDIRSETGKEELLTVSSARGIVPRKSANVTMFKAESYLGYKLCWPGDLVINSLWAWARGLGVSKNYGIISSAYGVYRISDGRRGLPGFIHYLVRSEPYQWELHVRSRGVWTSRLQLTDDRFLNSPFPLPPPEEQAVIVRYLDWACGRLDRAIRAEREIIALLNEQKQNIVNSAVTRGLNPNVSRRPSGVPSLGDVPSQWRVLPLKLVSSIQSGITLGKQYLSSTLVEFPYLRVANVQAGRLNLSVVKTLRVPRDEVARSMLRIGDVLMTEGGDPDKLGRGCVWDGQIENCLHQNHIFAVRPKTGELTSAYLSAVLDSRYARQYFQITSKQTTNLASTNRSTIGRFRLPLPPPSEQLSILQGLTVETGPLTAAISRAETEIALLLQYRTRLIADVVTGKLDVRDAAAKLPDTSVETEGAPELETEELNLEEELVEEE